jgi:SAM-dependent methyltransferase
MFGSVSFAVTADAYARFMGRFSAPLAHRFLDVVAPPPGARALDVGCGPGALTTLLVERLGAEQVAAIDPSAPFVAALRERLPAVDVRLGRAEELPFDDDGFDVALAQLVVHFMADPVAGLTEMRRVTRPDGVVAATVWDHAGLSGPLATFWQAVRELDPTAPGESDLPGTRDGHLVELAAAAEWRHVEDTRLAVQVDVASYDDWWTPYTLGVGPAGSYVTGLDDAHRTALRARCLALLPTAPFTMSASAWTVRARA